MHRMLLLAGAAMSPASLAHAQAPPAPATVPPAPTPAPTPAATPAPTEDEIVVRAQRDQRTSIDRETYIVRDTAQARTSNALDLLGRIPAVTVQPDSSIRLLGTTGVTVLVDGRPSANPNILRDLQGSEIARIEVVSNPSAQFSASGTGGVINIITRRNAPDGLRGSLTASVSRYDGHELRAAPSWTSGDWTISGNVGWTANGSVSESTRERVSLDPSRVDRNNLETIDSRSRFEFVSGNGQVSYRLSNKKTVTFQGGLIAAESRTVSDSLITRSANPGAPIAQFTTSDFNFQAYGASLEYRAEGSRPGELLTTSIQQQRYSPSNEVASDFGAGRFRFRSDAFTRGRIFKLDYVRPLEGGRRLLVGGTASETRDFSLIEQGGSLPLGANPFPTASIIDGSVLEAAAYGSYQFPLLGGTLLVGLRAENRNYDFADAGQGEGPSDTHFFPSAHLERKLASWLTGTISYSRRISWPAVQQLSPAIRFSDPTTASAGNPELRPELTDAFEVRLRGEIAKQTVSLTLFNRRTDDLFSSLSTFRGDGVLVTQPVNVGVRDDLGASVAVQGGIARGFTYSFNGSLIDRSIEGVFRNAQVQKSTSYSASAQLDYRDGQDGRRGADRVSFSATYSGPYDDGLLRRSAFFRAGATWSHAITDRLSSVVTVDDLFGPTQYRNSTFSDTTFTRTTTLSDGPRVKLGLTYSFGRPGQPQPPSSTGPSIPVPGAQ